MEKIICLFESCELCIKLSTKMVAPCLKKQKEKISLIFYLLLTIQNQGVCLCKR